MNANIPMLDEVAGRNTEEVIRMLNETIRQQQAEIERLTMLCDCMTTESNRKGNEIEELKTHPVKELTDEEIIDELVKVKHTWVATTSVWYEFEKEELKKAIRAILRKVQEK